MNEKTALPEWLANWIRKRSAQELQNPELRKTIKDFLQEAVSDTARAGNRGLGNAAASLGRRATVAGGLGAAAGAVTNPQDRIEGAGRGALGGLVGGAAGASFGRLSPRLGMLPGASGAILGGAAGGLSSEKEATASIKTESIMDGHEYAGVVLDWYDDDGETLKQKFPTIDKVPEIIKQADVRPKEKLANEDFALIMIDKGYVFRKFACADAGTTAMSVVYFMEHGDKLPEHAQKLAASNLVAACTKHRLLPPAVLTKIATSTEPRREISDVTGKSPKTLVKISQGSSSDDFAVVTEDGRGHYPIHNWNMVKKAEAYFLENKIRMQPEIRRQYAVKLAQKSFIMGYPLNQEIVELGALGYNHDGHLQAAIDMRKIACAPESGAREFLDDLFEKRAELNPEVYAEVLKRFDIQSGLDKGWDQVVLDPWSSTFGVKTAAEVIWEDGADRITLDALQNLADNRLDLVVQRFTYQVANEFKKDPKGIFDSMPLPQKKILARMASDSESDGWSSEHGTNTPHKVTMEKKSSGPVEWRNAAGAL